MTKFFCYACHSWKSGSKNSHTRKVHQKSVHLSLKVSPVSVKFPTTNARHCTVHKTEEVFGEDLLFFLLSSSLMKVGTGKREKKK